MPKLNLAIRKISLSIAAIAVAGCSGFQPIQEKVIGGKIQASAEQAKADVVKSINLRAGDTLASAFRAMGLLDGHTYILDGDAALPLPGNSAKIANSNDLIKYFEAYGRTVTLTNVDDSSYVRVAVTKNEGRARVTAAADCPVVLSGVIPMGPMIDAIGRQAKLNITYADVGATAYAGVLYPVGYRGTCAGALEYLGRKADLAVTFGDTGVEFQMMDTATIDLGIPLRDRKIVLDILADGRIANSGTGTGSTGTTGTSGTTSGVYGGSGQSGVQSGGGKSLQSVYATNYVQSVKAVLDSMRTPFGTWHYVPETGQIFIRDRAEAVAAAKVSLSRMAQAFQGRFEVTLTLYRMTVSKDRQISGSITRMINENLTATFGAPAAIIANAMGTINYDNSGTGATKTRKGVVQLLSEWGAIETLDTFSLTLQAGIPQTLKIANNTEYVRNVSTTTTGSVGTVTASIEQANATDGSFVSMQARQAEAGKIAVDYGAFINRLDGFDITKTQTSEVKSQRGFERTFDTMAIVDDGIPYVASIVSQKSRNDKQATLPGLEETGAVGPLLGGNREDVSAKTYIVVMVEARRQ